MRDIFFCILRTAYGLLFFAAGLLSCGQESPQPTSLAWSTYVGASCSDEGFGIAVDDSGNTYLTGFTCSADLPVTAGAFDTTFNGGTIDALVIKLDPSGSALRYATFLGGSGPDRACGIAVDEAGHAFVTGRTRSTDFPVTTGALDTSQNGDYDLFVAKLDPMGGRLVYATFVGGCRYDNGQSIALDRSGHAYVTGVTRSPDFPTTSGTFSPAFHDSREADAFVAKLDPAGGALEYATFLGGEDEDWGMDVAVDAAGHAYVGLLTSSGDFPVTEGAFDATCDGLSDAAVVKLNPSGSFLLYATFLGGERQDWCQSIAVDDSGHAFLTGVTHSGDFPSMEGAFDASHNGRGDAFVVKMNPVGSRLLYSTLLGGTDDERGTDIAVDVSGCAYLSGITRSVNFPTTSGAFDTSYNGKADAFMARLDPTGSDLMYATFFGGSADDASHGLAVDRSGGVYLTGWTESIDLPVTRDAFDDRHNGREDIFVVKLRLNDVGGRRPSPKQRTSR
jgi:hypothetical protein